MPYALAPSHSRSPVAEPRSSRGLFPTVVKSPLHTTPVKIDSARALRRNQRSRIAARVAVLLQP